MTVPDAPTRVEIVRTRDDVLRAAVARVVSTIELDVVSSEYVEDLAQVILVAADGGDVEDRRAVLERHRLFDWLLDAIGDAVLRGPVPANAETPSLDVLRAIAALRRERGPAGMNPLTQEDLRSILGTPDAFGLLVEVAHDLRSPLTSVLLLAETLRDGQSGEVSELQRSQLGLIYSAAFGLAAMASDIMDLARRKTNLTAADAELYAFAEIFHGVERLVQPIADEKGLDLRLVVPDRGHARGHPHALSRVLLNLTTNALKFTDKGSVELGVVRHRRSRLEFYVQDTGRGIPASRLPELFRPFKRRLGQSHDDHYFFSGSGVGLSIAKRLVEAMGSELSIESSDEKGTRFSFVVGSG
jgi:signal transduction histidine kinase